MAKYATEPCIIFSLKVWTLDPNPPTVYDVDADDDSKDDDHDADDDDNDEDDDDDDDGNDYDDDNVDDDYAYLSIRGFPPHLAKFASKPR